MTTWNDLFEAKTSTELFILLSDALNYLSGKPEVQIRRICDDGKVGLRMQVSQSLAILYEDKRHLRRPVTQEFVLMQDGTLSWEMKLTGERIIGPANIQTRLRQVMEDSQEHLMFAEDSHASGGGKATGPTTLRAEERVLVGYIPESTKPTLTWRMPREGDDLPREGTG